MFQGVQSIALSMAQEFGFTREIEDRVQAPCPIWLVAVEKVLSGTVQGLIFGRNRLAYRLSRPCRWRGGQRLTSLVDHRYARAAGVHNHGIPRLVLGTSFEARNIGLMFGFVILPITFLGGTYYQWTRLTPVKIGEWHWLQTIVLINPLIIYKRGMRAAFTQASHMHLYIIYPVLVGFCALFLSIGLHNFRRKVLS